MILEVGFTWSEDIWVRGFIAGLVLLGVCSSLLGVLVGWKLREREVKVLKRTVAIQRLQLSKRPMTGVMPIGRRVGKTILDEPLYEECGAKPPDEADRWMKCSKPKGHDLKANGGPTQHGYAGVFWGEGKR